MTSRLTVDIPDELHRRFKIEAAILDTNIKTLVAEAMEFYFSKKLNAETLETFAKTDRVEELTTFDTQEDFVSYLKNIKNRTDLDND